MQYKRFNILCFLYSRSEEFPEFEVPRVVTVNVAIALCEKGRFNGKQIISGGLNVSIDPLFAYLKISRQQKHINFFFLQENDVSSE